jgi:hypothetical protein
VSKSHRGDKDIAAQDGTWESDSCPTPPHPVSGPNFTPCALFSALAVHAAIHSVSRALAFRTGLGQLSLAVHLWQWEVTCLVFICVLSEMGVGWIPPLGPDLPAPSLHERFMSDPCTAWSSCCCPHRDVLMSEMELGKG